MTGGKEALDGRHPFGDEQLVALAATPSGVVGELDVVGEAGIVGAVDGDHHGIMVLPPSPVDAYERVRDHRTDVPARIAARWRRACS